ncbi:tectonic-2-like [Centruroides sculpturatus]|uniref:tectonic-2-like n=1 Tax=Centruroides sculpturatus TaxID=218467 RepID=UPI000C6D98EA|nr:tectonic-2-like [Centruroides sculpturatus]
MNLILLERLKRGQIFSYLIILFILFRGTVPYNTNFQFWAEILTVKIPPLGSIDAFLEGILLQTSNPQCKINVFQNYTKMITVKEKLKCEGLSKTQQQNNWQMTVLEKEKSSYAIVNVQNLNKTMSLTIDYVVVTCCLPAENKNQEMAILTLIVLPMHFYKFNVDNLTDNERQYKQPHFLEVSPCPCDITENHCDILCCCDQECPSSIHKDVECIKSSYGGNKVEVFGNWNCKSTEDKSFEFRQFLCIFAENTPFLGYYYHDISKANDHSAISKILSKAKILQNKQFKTEEIKSKYAKKSSVKHLHQISQNLSTSVASYKYRDTLRVISSIHEIQRFTEWYIPVSLYTGHCSFQFPVRFLQNYQSFCALKVKHLCEGNQMASTMLDAKYYIKDGYEILQVPGSNETLKPNIIYVLKKYSPFNDSFQYKELDSYFPPMYSNGICWNIVHEVNYIFFWSGGRILMMNITIVIGDIYLKENSCENKLAVSVLTQKISVKFQYKVNNLIMSRIEENKTNENYLEFRSGNPGYEMDYPVLSAIINENDNYSIQIGDYLKLWNPSVNGDCRNSSHVPIVFGRNSISGCTFQVNIHHLQDNCTSLRWDLMNLFKDLYQANYISKGGNPDLENISDFLKIIVSNLNESEDSERGTLETCHDLPYHLQVQIVYAEVGRINGRSIWRILGSFVKYHLKSWTPHCSINGCGVEDIPSFPLTSSVNFVCAPWKTKRTKRFWDYGEIEYCNREICFEELFYPFAASFRSDLVFHVSFWSVMILLFVLPLLWLTRKQFY